MSTEPAVLALDIGGTKLGAAIGDASGQLRRSRAEPTCATAGAESVLCRALTLAKAVLAEEQQAGGTVGALGVSTMGITGEHGTELAPNVPGWDKLQLPPAFRDAFPGLPLAIENDVRAATLAELTWGALVGIDVGVYLNLGTGTAAGLVVGGQVVRGGHGAAGEIGYSLIAGWQQEPLAVDGAALAERHLGGRGVAERARERFGAELDLPGLLERAEDDREVATFLDELWDDLSQLTANLVIAVDPEVLVLGGGYLRSKTPLITRLTSVVGRAAPFPPRIEISRYRGDASLYGAVALATSAERRAESDAGPS